MDAVIRSQVTIEDTALSLLAAGDGPLVVLLHGIPTGAELWRGVLPHLADAGLRAVAPDLPGYGRTRAAPSADHTLTGCARLVARWLERSGSGPAWVVGHDVGGAVAQILAVRRPDLVSALTLANSVAHGSWPAPRARFATLAARAGLHRAMAGVGVVPNAYLRRQVRRGLSDPASASVEELDRVVWDGKFSDRRGRAAFERHLAALSPRDTAAVVDALPDLTVSCQLVWGTDDPFQTWHGVGQRLLRQLPDPDVTLLHRCGHLTPLECPQRLATALLDWRRPLA
jgi:2-hydroxymuconate-semialdehyde hydrolase